MCGICGGFVGADEIEAALDAMAHRGPDGRGSWAGQRAKLGHVRLSVIDLTEASAQPFCHRDLVLVFNGEIWNYADLRGGLQREGVGLRTSGDTEVVAVMLEREGAAALQKLEGMFAMAWTADGGETVTVARDRHGEIPLHVGMTSTGPVFASELKGLRALGSRPDTWAWLEPATTMELSKALAGPAKPWYRVPAGELSTGIEEASGMVRTAVEHGARERAVADAPVCVLLSGGIDSAVSAWTLRQQAADLTAFVAWHDRRSPDLRAAREVAEALEIELVEVFVEAPTAADLSDVVRAIEMPHKAQVEIAWHCLALAREMRGAGFKVAVSGEGSDELWASYGFSWRGVRDQGWRPYRERLFREQHRKNFARCNKAFMGASVECRLPFLSTRLVELAMSLPMAAVREGGRPKAVLERAFADVLPPKVLRRPKLAFQDGSGIKAAAARAVSSPAAYYRAEFGTMFGPRGGRRIP